MARKKIENVTEVEVVKDDFVPELTPVVVIDKPKCDLSSEDLRKRILELLKDIDENRVELCQRMWQAQGGAYEEWGYATFKDYASKELGIKYGTACQLSRMGMFQEKYPNEFTKAISLGLSKGEEIARVANSENIDEWVEKARHISADELGKEVKNYMKALVPSEAQEALKNEPKVKDSMLEEQLKHLTYSFTHENYMTVCNAIAALQQANPNIRNDAEALAMICAEYVGANSFDKQGVEFASELLKKYENTFPLKLVIFDTENNQVVHGLPLVKELVKIALSEV